MYSFLSFHALSIVMTMGGWDTHISQDRTINEPNHSCLSLIQEMKTRWCQGSCRQWMTCACSLTCSPFSHRWMVTSWSPCTRSCGGGVQMRRVMCQRLTTKGSSVPMSYEACAQLSKRPVDTQNCNRQPCVEWVASSWGQVRNKVAFQGQPHSVG